MAITYKDINQLSQKSQVAGTEKIPVSDTQYITPNQIAALAPGGDTSDCVHKTGDETVGGDKTFTDNIGVVDADHIVYSGGGGGGGFTRGYAEIELGDNAQTINVEVEGEPKAFIMTNWGNTSAGLLMVVGDSSGCHGVYSAASTRQHNYTSDFTISYSNGTLTITAPNVTYFMDGGYSMVYYYGSGTLTFRTTSFSPGSGVTAATFTDANLTAVPAFYATMLESQVNNESYRRVACYTNACIGYDGNDDPEQTPLGMSFFSSSVTDTTSSFTVSYNNGLVINSGGTNAGGYFHNPGTYTLYYLMASDVAGGGSGGFQSLGDELDDKYTLPSSGIPKSDLASAVQTSLGKADTALQSYTETDPVFVASAAHGISSTDISNWNAKQKAITVSTSTPTSSQGSNGDIWIVI